MHSVSREMKREMGGGEGDRRSWGVAAALPATLNRSHLRNVRILLVMGDRKGSPWNAFSSANIYIYI